MMREYLPACYAIFATLGAGALIALYALEAQRASGARTARLAWAAAVCLAAAAAAVVAQFGRPAMVFAAFANPGSAIFRELVTLALGFLGAVLLAGLLVSGARISTTRAAAAAAAALGLLAALAVGSTLMMSWRPAWDTWTLVLPGAGYALLAASAAAAAFGSRQAQTDKDRAGPAMQAILRAEAAGMDAAEKPNVEKDDGALKLFAALSRGRAAALPALGIALYLAAIAMNDASRAAALQLLSDDLALLFWAGAVVIGILLPFALLRAGKRAALSGAAFLLAALGAGCWHAAAGSLG